jgi:hypothetical protein
MRMVPTIQTDQATGSERQVFKLLHKLHLGEESVALSSLNLSKHEYKRWSELDFVLVLPEGLLVIEVKGGRASAENGKWSYVSGRSGREKIVEKYESPMAQAQSGFSAIKRFLDKEIGKNLVDRGTNGFCVAFPKTTKNQASHFIGGTEMPSELIATKEDCRDVNAFKVFIERVFKYHSRSGKGRGWLPLERLKIVSCLRPSFDRIRPLSIALSKTREDLLALTEDQYKYLDALENSPRILCMGGAGCGKTMMAVESLRREMNNNPILVTGTPLLAKYLRGENVPDPKRIFSFDEIKETSFSKKYSVLIVDEGQQITNKSAFSLLGGLLDKPLQEARWLWFSDPNNQLSLSSEFDAGAQNDLQGWAHNTVNLKTNCRNTSEVIKAVEFVTGVALGSTRIKGSGLEVIHGEESDPDKMIEEAAKQIKLWVEEREVVPGQIILLSRLPIEASSIPKIAKLANCGYVPWKTGWEQNPSYNKFLAAGNIEDFRGLESPFVILCDLGGELGSLVTDLYLGMTRANFGLFVSCEKEAKDLLSLTRLNRLTNLHSAENTTN